MTTRVVVVEIPEGSTGRFLQSRPDPAIEQFSRVPAERATKTVDDLSALAAASSPVLIRAEVGGRTVQLTGSRAEATAIVLAAYVENGRGGIDELKAAIARGVRLGAAVTPPPPSTDPLGVALEYWSNRLLDKPLDSHFVEVIGAAEGDVGRMIADDLVQLEDAASAVFRQALEAVSQKVDSDRKELITADAAGVASFKTDKSGAPLPRATALVDACKAISELDRQILALAVPLGILHDVALALSPPLLETTATPGPAAGDAEKLEAIADALSSAASAAGEATVVSATLSKALRAAAELVRTAAEELAKLQELLFQLIKSRTLLTDRVRRSFPFLDLALKELGSAAVTDSSVATATTKALASYAEALLQLKEELDGGRMSVLRGTTTIQVMDPFADERPHSEVVPVLDRFLATSSPEAMLAASLTEAQHAGRITVWDQVQIVRQAAARMPEGTLALPAFYEVRRQQIIQGRRDFALGLGLVGLHLAFRGVAAAATFGMSEVVINTYFALDGIVGTIAAYARYTKETSLGLVATYLEGGMIEVDPSLLPAVLNALGAVSSVATLARLGRLAALLDVAQLGIVGFELAPALVEALATESGPAN